MRVESVTSAQNRKVKTLLALQEKARFRKEMGLFVVEGRRELEHCIRAGFEIDTLFYCPDIVGSAGGPSAAICYSVLKHHADPFRVNAARGPLPIPKRVQYQMQRCRRKRLCRGKRLRVSRRGYPLSRNAGYLEKR